MSFEKGPDVETLSGPRIQILSRKKLVNGAVDLEEVDYEKEDDCESKKLIRVEKNLIRV